MTFVNEYVSDEDKQKIDWASIPHPHFKDPRIKLDPRRWIVDRDRDIFLMWTGRGRDEGANQHDFLFWWKGSPMPLSLAEHWIDKHTVCWRRLGLSYPRSLQSEHEAIVNSIKQALLVYGGGFAPELGMSPVAVQFDF